MATIDSRGPASRRALRYTVLSAGAFVALLPFVYMVATSLKSYGETVTRVSAIPFHPDFWPKRPVWDNYATAWREVNLGRYFLNSVIIGVITVAGSCSIAALAAYAFAKMNFWGKNLFFYILLAMMMIPGQVLLIPNYITLARLHWLDRYEALIIPWLTNVFTIFLMRQFFMTLPDDLWDAAQIDGAGRFRFLWQIVIPLSKPVIITAAIFDFLNSWNSLFWPLIVTTRPEMRTLMVGLQAFNQDAGSDFHLLMAASCFAVLPVVLLFFFLQRFFIQGIARTGLKS